MKLVSMVTDESGFTRITWMKDDGIPHIQGVAADEDVSLHLAAVNADMERRGLPTVTDEDRETILAARRVG